MIDPIALEWRDNVILTRDLVAPGDREEFFRRVRRHEFLPIFRGVFVREEHWRSLSIDERYRARVKAAAAFADCVASAGSMVAAGSAASVICVAGRPVFSNHSAAALWRLAWIGDWPEQAHTVEPIAAGGRSNAMFLRHTGGVPDDRVEIDGLDVTTLSRTVVDLARTESFGRAVTLADSALRRTLHPIDSVPRTYLARVDLEAELDRVPMRHGSAKARRVIEFADGAADRPGESMSRVSMRVAGLPQPQLQVELVGASGRVWTVDFWWPFANLIGEFDGKSKYTEAEFLRGRTPQQGGLRRKAAGGRPAGGRLQRETLAVEGRGVAGASTRLTGWRRTAVAASARVPARGGPRHLRAISAPVCHPCAVSNRRIDD